MNLVLNTLQREFSEFTILSCVHYSTAFIGTNKFIVDFHTTKNLIMVICYRIHCVEATNINTGRSTSISIDAVALTNLNI